MVECMRIWLTDYLIHKLNIIYRIKPDTENFNKGGRWQLRIVYIFNWLLFVIDSFYVPFICIIYASDFWHDCRAIGFIFGLFKGYKYAE